ncbi:diguanylate cyclase [Marinomonas mediterranea]|uniref:diguanylate cyclase n=1 Tax=Marinomonas mediterranea (strain ATCC 700492 / JCM 21426 / NBRC 103028 / MMB-1) TaxID=717774 RepID=F2JZQ1_MARM1|nr:diguanylate cyclase [Marinomonas mediterranea]ADZ90905.1 diguanylate cyclase [Marinomonas mediterranea MMB-1]
MFSINFRHANTWRALAVISITSLISMAILVFLLAHNMDRLLTKERYQHVRSHVMMARHLVTSSISHKNTQPENTLGEKLMLEQLPLEPLLDELSKLRYLDESYFWVLDFNGVMLMHPYSPNIVGVSTLSMLDRDGDKFVRDIIATARDGGGFVEYSWTKPGGDIQYPKVSYVTLVEELGWIIGSGAYIDDLEEAKSAEVVRSTMIALTLLLLNTLVLLFVARKYLNIFHNKSIKDELTGLLNRRYLEEIHQDVSESADAHKQPISVLFFDIDHFKRVNDEYGHQCGDITLAKVGDIVSNHTRVRDFSFRYGGEEFVMIVRSDQQEAFAMAEELRQAIENSPINLGDQYIHVTVSIGVATRASNDVCSIKDVIAKADSLMYLAKQAGRNQVKV